MCCSKPVYTESINNGKILLNLRKPCHHHIRLIVTQSGCLAWPVQFLWWMTRSVSELLQGMELSGWSEAGLVPWCPNDEALMSNETLQTRARNILIEISRSSILCLYCVRYWVPITGYAVIMALTSQHQTSWRYIRHQGLPHRRRSGQTDTVTWTWIS